MRERILQLLGRLDSPKVVLALTALGYLAFIALRLNLHHFDPSAFILAGDRYTNPQVAQVAGVSPVRASDGYDGQYYYRLALDPFTTQQTAHGITLDSPAYRQQRILYPLLVWALSLRLPAAVPWMMIGVNYLAVCLLGWLAARTAKAEQKHALWGLGLALYPGLLLSLARDLVEAPAMALLLGGLLLLRRDRPTWAALCLALAVLTKETTLLVALAGLLVRLTGRNAGGRESPNWATSWTFALLPLAVAAILQTLLWRVWGQVPLMAGGHNLGLPFEGVNALVRRTINLADAAPTVAAAELGFVLLVAVLVGVTIWRRPVPPVEKTAWALSLVLAACLTERVWVEDWAYLRVLSEWYLLGWLILLRAPALVRLPVAAGAVVLWLFLSFDRAL